MNTAGTPSHRRARLPRRGARAARGVVLLEALVGILIFSIGVLGLVALQASMTRTQTVAKFRADAAYVANAAIGVLRGDSVNLGNYAAGGCGGFAACADLQNKVAAALPGGAIAIDPNIGTGEVTVTVTWSAANEDAQRYVTNTYVRRSNDPSGAP